MRRSSPYLLLCLLAPACTHAQHGFIHIWGFQLPVPWSTLDSSAEPAHPTLKNHMHGHSTLADPPPGPGRAPRDIAEFVLGFAEGVGPHADFGDCLSDAYKTYSDVSYIVELLHTMHPASILKAFQLLGPVLQEFSSDILACEADATKFAADMKAVAAALSGDAASILKIVVEDGVRIFHDRTELTSDVTTTTADWAKGDFVGAGKAVGDMVGVLAEGILSKPALGGQPLVQFFQWTNQYHKKYPTDHDFAAAMDRWAQTKAAVEQHNSDAASTYTMQTNAFADVDPVLRAQAMYPMRSAVRGARPPSPNSDEPWAAFHRWTVDHNRTYHTPTDLTNRWQVWLGNHQWIQAHNELGNFHRYSVGHNAWSDRTDDEYTTQLLSPMGVMAESTASMAQWLELVQEDTLPASVDWRDHGVVTPIKNQAQCGSCWAFSAVETTESALAIKTGKLPPPLSPQELVSCDAQDNGCDGGNFDSAWSWIQANGLVTEEQYPYVSGKDDQSEPCNRARSKDPFVQTIASYSDIPSNRADLLSKAIATNGPVSAAIDASATSFRFYSDGVYDATPSIIQLDHGISLVGYTPDAWILRNSWSEQWGEAGYMRLSREAGDQRGALGVAMNAGYVNL